MRSLAGICAVLAITAGCADPCADGLVCTIAGNGLLGFNGDGMDARDSWLAAPTSVTVDPEGRPVVIDYSNMRVRVLDDGVLTTIVGDGRHAYSEIGAAPRDTPLENPVDAVWGPDGLLYVLPQHEGRVIRVKDGVIERFAGTGAIDHAGDGGPAVDAAMGYTGGFAFGPDGSLYISDNTHSRVRRIDPTGIIATVLGTGERALGTPGYGPEMAIDSPERIAIDGDRLLVADTANDRVLGLDLTTLEATVIAGTGERGFAGDGGQAVDAQLDRPVGVLPGRDGGVLIGDLENHVVRFVSADGSIRTVLGTGARWEDAEDGLPATEMALRKPAGMAWAPNGDLLIAERGGHRVLRWIGAADAL